MSIYMPLYTGKCPASKKAGFELINSTLTDVSVKEVTFKSNTTKAMKKLILAALFLLAGGGAAFLLNSNESPEVAQVTPAAKPDPKPARIKTVQTEEKEKHAELMTGTIGGFTFTSEVTAEPVYPVKSLVPELKNK